MRAEIVILPAFLAGALINGDTSGLDPDDIRWLESAVAACSPGRIVSCDGEPFFSRWCEITPYGFFKYCGMLEYTVLYPEE